MGYHRAGFDEIVGVDTRPQSRYPFVFVQADALEYLAAHGREFDAIHASPPCQAHTSLKTMWNARRHVDLIPATRELLRRSGKPYIIENVPGAPLRSAVTLCGTMFGLGASGAQLRRHRLFELSSRPWVPLSSPPPCRHRGRSIGVYGGGHGVSLHRYQKGERSFTAAEQRQAMGIDWMTVDELSQAIPPAYTEFLGHGLMAACLTAQEQSA